MHPPPVYSCQRPINFTQFHLRDRRRDGGVRQDEAAKAELGNGGGFPPIVSAGTGDKARDALLNPFGRVAFLAVDFPHPFRGEFGVFYFFETLVSDLSEPTFERLGFGRWDGLDETQKLFRVRHVGEPLLAIRRGHL